MKLNNYQKILLTWAAILLIGYIASIWLFADQTAFFTMWFVIGIVGLVVQLKLAGLNDTKTKLIQLLWIAVVLGGTALNILERNGSIPLFGHNPLIGWPLSVAFAYVVIALIYSFNRSYLLLAGLYLIFAGVVYIVSDFTTGLVVSGVAFAALCGADAMLDNTKLRTSK